MTATTKLQLVELVGQALARHRAQDFGAAEDLYRRVLGLKPDHGDALHLYGCLSDDLGKLDQAVELLQKAVKCNPSAFPYFYNLGNVLSKQKRLGEAIASYRAAIKLKPDYAVAHNNLGRALAKKGDSIGAQQSFLNAIRFSSGYADPHFNLAVELETARNVGAAIASYKEAINIRPNYAEAHFSLANALSTLSCFDEAARHYLNAAKLEPDNSKILTNLGNVLLKMGRQNEAIQSFQTALAIDPLDVFSHSNLILAASYISPDPADMAAQCKQWGRVHSDPLRSTIRPLENVPEPERRLRIGYVSADFRQHAAAYWIEPLLLGHQQSEVDVFCYSNSAQVDGVTLRMKSYVDTWVDCAVLNDDALAERIRLDQIDILVDLSGHTHGHRLLVFARQPAPVQVSWFGFPVSTGVDAVQYRLTDETLDPPHQNDAFYCEKLVYLPRFYATFRPEPSTPPAGDSPYQRNGYITFASLNSFAKITTPALECWADILLATPDSRMLIQAAGLDEPAMADAVLDVFARRGVPEHRLTMRGWCKIEDFLALGQQVDITLDSFPFNGGVTTFQALWMGLPVVTMSGQSAASRVGRSILQSMGLRELVAETVEQYRDITLELASDIGRMAELRANLRDRMSASGLLDGASLAQEAEAAYRQMWRTWCLTQ